jgi:hypothetical protein
MPLFFSPLCKGYSYEHVDGSVRGKEKLLTIRNFRQQPIFIFLLNSMACRKLEYDGNKQIIGKTRLYIPTISTFSHNSIKGEAITKKYRKEGIEVIAIVCHGTGLLMWQHFYSSHPRYDLIKEVRLKFKAVEHNVNLLYHWSGNFLNEFCDVCKKFYLHFVEAAVLPTMNLFCYCFLSLGFRIFIFLIYFTFWKSVFTKRLSKRHQTFPNTITTSTFTAMPVITTPHHNVTCVTHDRFQFLFFNCCTEGTL